MEKNNLEKTEALRMTALQKEVQALKNEMEAKSLKEQIIAEILYVQDREVLEKVAKGVRDAIFPRKPGSSEEITAEQGNR